MSDSYIDPETPNPLEIIGNGWAVGHLPEGDFYYPSGQPTQPTDGNSPVNNPSFVPVDHDPFAPSATTAGVYPPADITTPPLWVTAVNHDPYAEMRPVFTERERKEVETGKPNDLAAAALIEGAGSAALATPVLKSIGKLLSLPHDVTTGEVGVHPGLRREDVTDIPAPDVDAPRPGGYWPFSKLAPVAWEPNDEVIEPASGLAGLVALGETGMIAKGALRPREAVLPHSALKPASEPAMAPIRGPNEQPIQPTQAVQPAQAVAPANIAGGGRRGERGGNSGMAQAQRAAETAAGSAPKLEGLPDKAISVGGEPFVPGPVEKIHKTAESYMRGTGRPYEPPQTYQPVDVERAKRIAEEYEKMEHAPNDPHVKRSYDALISESEAQLAAIQESGLKIEFIKPGQHDPYAATPRLATKDMLENNHLWVFPTEGGFGSPLTGVESHPMLRPTNIVIDGRRLLANDVFRIVHDYFGHFKDGVGFRAAGEENAWRSHSAMYSDEARPAMTTETRGQNSWLNYGPHSEHNQGASAKDTIYAQQKAGILPDWVMQEGRLDPPMQPAPPFYSALEKNIENMKPEKAPAQQWSGIIHNTPGIKPDELKWLAVDDWLKAQKGQVTKSDLLDYIRANQPEVHVIERGGKGREAISPDELDELIMNELDEWTQREMDEELNRNPYRDPLPEEIAKVEKAGNKWTFHIQPSEEAKPIQSHRDFDSEAEAKKIAHREAENWIDEHAEQAREQYMDELRESTQEYINNGHDFSRRVYEIKQENPVELTDKQQRDLENAMAERAGDRETEWAYDQMDRDVDEHISEPDVEIVSNYGKWHYLIKDADGEVVKQAVFPTEHEAKFEGSRAVEAYYHKLRDDWIAENSEDYYDRAHEEAGIDYVQLERDVRDDLDLPPLASGGGTKFHDYMSDTPPGGKNYRETVFTLPGLKNPNIVGQKPQDVYNVPRAHGYGKEELDENRFAHSFVDDRTIGNKKYLNVVELQSDWHHAGHENGYRGITKVPTAEEVSELESAALQARSNLDKKIAEAFPDSQQDIRLALGTTLTNDAKLGRESATPVNDGEAIKELAKINAAKIEAHTKAAVARDNMQRMVPDAPFKTTWPELAMKRMIRKAIDEGYDGVSWVSGQTVGERYSLNKHLDTLMYDPKEKRLWGSKDGASVVSKHGIEPDQLASYVGKDIAKRLLDAPLETREPPGYYEEYQVHRLNDLNVNVGASFQKKLYDDVLPREMSKLVKKFGAKVETKQLDNVKGSLGTVHAIELTPQLKRMATKQGFPLFSAGVPLFRLVPVDHNPFAGNDDRGNQSPAGSGNNESRLPILAAPSGVQGFLPVPQR